MYETCISYNLQNSVFLSMSTSDTAGVKTGKQKAKSPRAALWRAILFPGWGQFYNEKYLKGTLILGLESFFIGRAIAYNQQKQNSTGTDEKDAYTRKRNDEVWRLLITRLLSILDAYVDAHFYDFDESTKLNASYVPADHRFGERLELSLAVNW
ncbi:MAG: hypothetical protein H6696_15455 [Deferribacteres bacterium]|nr:hypothetical protein [Deferribacteres bacterium]